jgi:predicted RNase H-like HicB family nuclease
MFLNPDFQWSTIMQAEYLFSYTLRHQDDGRWSAICNELPGVATYGADQVEAIKALADALDGAIHVYRSKGWPIPAIVAGAQNASIQDTGVLLV